MLDPFDKITVDTLAGVYVIALYYDIDAPVPDYTDDGGFVYRGDGHTIAAQYGDAAHDVADLLRRHNATNDSLWDHQHRSAAAIGRYLRIRHGLSGVHEVVRSGDHYHAQRPDTDRHHGIEGMAWAPPDAARPEDYTRGIVATYDAWANGNVYGYIVTSPDGHEVDSCWDFYADPTEPLTADAPHGLAYPVSQARAAIDADVDHRTVQANTVGAGLIGLI